MQLCTKWCLSAINTAPVHHLWKLLSLPSALLSLLSHSAHVASCNTAMGWISHTPHWSLAVGSCTWFSESLFHWFWVLTSSSAFSSSFLGNYCGSVGKESTCNAGDPGLIPGSGRSPGEGIGYPLQYSWASLVAQLVKNPPAMRETWVRSLGWEEKGHPLQYSGLENFMDCKVHGVAESRRWLSDFHFHRICFHEAWTYWQALWDKIDWTFVNC